MERARWAAQPTGEGGAEQVPARLTVHQSAYSATEFASPLEHVRFLEREHRSRGWVDVSYHYLVDGEGTTYEGRPRAIASQTPTPYDPDGHLTVCLLGRFDFERLPETQLAAAVTTLAWLAADVGIATETLAGHTDFTDTTPCPGRAVYRLLRDGSMRARVDGLLAAGAPRVVGA